MEVKIEEFSLKPIEWNKETLIAEVKEKTEIYKGMVFTEEQVSVAKQERATLNRVREQLETIRKDVKKKCLEPYNKFEKDIKEIESYLESPISIIDTQLEDFNQKRKKEKADAIVKLFNELNHYEWLNVAMISNPTWENVSCSISSIEAEIKTRLVNIRDNIAVLEALPNFSFEGVEYYKKTLDMTQALFKVQELYQMQLKKQEAEKMIKKQKEALKVGQIEGQTDITDLPFMAEPEIEEYEEKTRDWITFSAYMNYDEALKLREFFETNGISFKKGD